MDRHRKARVNNTEAFIAEARRLHGDKYDYSLAEYVRADTSVKIICPKHGVFEQKPSLHIHSTSKHGCPGCALDKQTEAGRCTQDEFKDKVRELYGDVYDLSKVEYVNNNTKVIIGCPVHGEFSIKPRNFTTRGKGCPLCSRNEYLKLDYMTNYERYKDRCKTKISELQEKADGVYGERYVIEDFSDHPDCKRVHVRCFEHGLFEVNAYNFVVGQSQCPECQREKIEERRTQTLDKIVAYEEGKAYNQLPLSEVIDRCNEVHNFKYDYSKVIYRTLETPVTIICPEHGEFTQRMRNHMDGKGCRKCSDSKLEKLVGWMLSKSGVPYMEQVMFPGLVYKQLMTMDFYLPEHKIAIECQGQHHYHPVEKFGGEERFIEQQERDQIKRDYFKDHESEMVEIPYWFTREEMVSLLRGKGVMIHE